MKRQVGRFAFIAGLLFIAATTLIPLPQQRAAAAATPLWCLVCGEYGGVDVLNNILLFMPFGLGLRLLGVPTSRVVTLGSAVSFGIELLQLSVIPGRDASLSDVLTNSLGTWVGAVVGTHLGQLLSPVPRQARLLALTAGLVWLGVQTASALLLRPWAPDVIRGAAWTRSIAGRIPFDGTVTEAAVSGRPLGNAPDPAAGLAAKLRRGDVELDVGLLSGSHQAVWSPVFEVLGLRGPLMSLEAVHGDLAFHPPLQSSRVRLRRPALRLHNALPSTAGVPVRVVARLRSDTLSANWSIAEGRVWGSLQVLGPSLGWSLLTPFRYAFGPEARWLTGVWLAGWLAVIAYWSAAMRAPAMAIITSLALLLFTGLVLLPLLFGYPPSHWTEWLGAAAGIAIGHTGHHFATYLGERCGSLSISESS